MLADVLSASPTEAVGVGGGANCTTVVYAAGANATGAGSRVLVNFVNDWIAAYAFISQNQEKLFLYVTVSVTAGVLLLLGLIIGRLLVSRHRAKRDAKFHANNETLPNGFTDDISEIDADIDLTTPVPVPLQDTRYDGVHTFGQLLPETQLAERLHGERYFGDSRIPLSPGSAHTGHSVIMSGNTVANTAAGTGMRVDLGNHMVGTDSLHTILRPEGSRGGLTSGKTSYYYG